MNRVLKSILSLVMIGVLAICLNGCEDEDLFLEYTDDYEDSDYSSSEYADDYEDSDNFDPMEYGFENDFGMTKWIEVTEYSYNNKTATYKELGWEHCIYEFKSNVRYDYTRFEELNLTGKYQLSRTNTYQIMSNDCISLDNGKTYTIMERIVLPNNNLVIKALINRAEKWFVLEDQIDWEKSPIEENAEEDYRSIFTYFFK